MVGAVVGVVFGVHAVADNKDLHILEQAAAYPERIPMVAIDLVEGFLQPQTATLKFNCTSGRPLISSVTSKRVLRVFCSALNCFTWLAT